MELVSLTPTQLTKVSLASFVFCLILYKSLRFILNDQDKVAVYRIFVGILSSLLFLTSFVTGCYYNHSFMTDPDGPSSVYENLTLCFCLGYYIFESLYSLFNRGDTHSVMFFHHFVTTIGLITLLYFQQSGTEANIMLGGTEVTTPLLVAIRYTYKRWGKTHIRKCALFYVLATCLFITFRLVIGSYVMYIFVTHPKPMLLFKIFGMAIYIVGWPFTYSILIFGFKNFFKPLIGGNEKKLSADTGTYRNGTDYNRNEMIKSDKTN